MHILHIVHNNIDNNIEQAMQYTEVIPKDITNLPKYSISGEQFICTCIVLILLTILSLIFMIFWIYRTYKQYTNTDYIADYQVKIQAQKTMKRIAMEDDSSQDKFFVSKCRQFSRYQSRMLEFWCLVVVVAINVGTFTCNIMEAAAFAAAILLFFLFNVIRISENRILRVLWILPIIACYIPFYIFSKLITR